MPRGTGCTAVRSRTSWTLRAATVDLRANTLFEANGFDRPDGDPIVRYAEPIDVSADRIRSVC